MYGAQPLAAHHLGPLLLPSLRRWRIEASLRILRPSGATRTTASGGKPINLAIVRRTRPMRASLRQRRKRDGVCTRPSSTSFMKTLLGLYQATASRFRYRGRGMNLADDPIRLLVRRTKRRPSVDPKCQLPAFRPWRFLENAFAKRSNPTEAYFGLPSFSSQLTLNDLTPAKLQHHPLLGRAVR